MRINCEILDLRAFLAVLDQGGFQKAAHYLNMSQPALSRRIKALEQSLDIKLLERSTRKVVASRVGRQLEPVLRRMVQDFEDSVARVSNIGERRLGRVTIACSPTTACRFVPHVIRKFRKEYPDIRLRILDLTATEALECVSSGEADFGINILGASRSEFRFTPLLDEDFVLACRTDHPLAAMTKVNWSDLQDFPLIISQMSGNRVLIDHALSKYNIKLNWLFEVVRLSTSFGLVEMGVGMSVLPRMAVPARGHPIIVPVDLVNPTVTRTIGILEHPRNKLSPPAQHFYNLVVSESNNFHNIL